MNNAVATPPAPVNETVLGYAPGSPERRALQRAVAEMRAAEAEVLPVIGGRRVETGRTAEMRPPHDLSHLLGTYHKADRKSVV